MQQKIQTTQNIAKQNYASSVTSDDTRPVNEVGLIFYNAAKRTQGLSLYTPNDIPATVTYQPGESPLL